MYKLQLICKYLIKRRIAWVALIAVMLCTAMVLVVVSVMGGWLRVFVNSFHGMTGDVVITTSSLTGFPDYQEMIDRVRKEIPGVSAVPIIRSGGLIKIGPKKVEIVQVLGYPPDIGLVNGWPATLHDKLEDRRKNLATFLAKPGLSADDRATIQTAIDQLPFSLRTDEPYEEDAPRVKNPRNRPGMIVSSLVVGIRRSNKDQADTTRGIMYSLPTTLTLVPVAGNRAIDQKDAVTVPFWIVDDSASQVWQLDNNNVYISFDEAQRDLRMDGDDGQPARCSEVQIKAPPGTDLNALSKQVQQIVDSIRNEHPKDFTFYDCDVMTWEEQQGTFIKAVQHEVVLTTALFGIISSVAVLLIFCIFYMIVVEKTKDIGIIKSVGATGSGILSLFLGYGLAIGVIGATLGFIFAYFFVRYINEIHAWLGQRMGIVIWTPDTYQFDTIPNKMEPKTVVWVLIVAVLSAVLGALLPAMRAAVMNPVEALRYE
jgi:lipoprotein-releasing system permease protein